MNAGDRIGQIARDRELLQLEIAATRRRIAEAARTVGREAVVAVAVAAAGRFLTRRFRWGSIAAAALGFLATRYLRR